MAINHKGTYRYITGLLGVIIILSLIMTPRFTLNSFTPCEKRDINIIYKFGNAEIWDEHKRYNELNTIRGIYMKDMAREGTLTARLCLTDEELETIINKAVEINFFNYTKLPKGTSDGKAGYSSEANRNILEISNGTIKKTLQWNAHGFESGYDGWFDNLKDLTDLIMNIIRNKPEYQELPQ